MNASATYIHYLTVLLVVTFFFFFQVAPIKDYLPKACPHGNSLILDSEVFCFVCYFFSNWQLPICHKSFSCVVLELSSMFNCVQLYGHKNNYTFSCQVLLVDNKTSKPLPFGTLGVHKVFLN